MSQPALEATQSPPPRESVFGAAAQTGMCGVMDAVKRVQGDLLRPYGFTSRRVVTSVGKVRVMEAGRRGRGPTWVFLHGFASEGVDYKPLLKPLNRHCGRILVVDLPGHGQSPSPMRALTPDMLTQASEEVLRLCTEADEPMVLVGNSMGGLGALLMAHLFRQRAQGLVLMSPAGAPTPPTEMDAIVESFNVPNYQAALDFVDKLFINGNRLRKVYALGVWAHMSRPHLQALLQAYRKYPPLTPADLQGLPPTLLIWGDGDNFLPPSNRAFFVQHLAATLVTDPSFSHSPYLDKAGEVAAVILSWARDHPGLLAS